jgi:hypothetical protein
MISEVARAVLAELEAPLEKLRTDPALVEKYQRLIFERQVEAEKKAGESFVSDRAFDNLAYAAEHTTIVADIIESQKFRDYMRWVSDGVVFFIRPNRQLLREDGTREMPYWESVVRIDGMVKFMLEQFRVPYLPIESVSMQERIRVVDFVLSQQRAKREVYEAPLGSNR